MRHLDMTSRDTEVNTVGQWVASRHSVADTYATLGTKDTTRRSGSVGQCGKSETEQDGRWVRRIGVAKGVEWYK